VSRFHLYFLCALLTVSSLGLFLYKALALRFPLVPGGEESIWHVEAQVTFTAKGRSTKVRLFLPQSNERFSVVNESFISRGYGLTTKKTGANRQATWSTRRAGGRQTLYYRSTVRRVEIKDSLEAEKEPAIIDSGFEGSFLEAAQSLIAAIRQQSADLDSFVSELLQHLRAGRSEESIRLLLGPEASTEKAIEAAVRILAEARVAARSVHGILLEPDNRDAPLRHWLEVYDRGRWRAYDFSSGGEGIPEERLAWWRGPDPLGDVQGGQRFHVVLSVAVNQEEAIRSAMERARLANPALLEFSLFRLPIQTQSVYRVLLLIPLGAFLVVLFRNVVGVSTFGTFMPVLIALAFRETQLLWGIALFSLMVGLGLAFRFYLDRLKLLLVPRRPVGGALSYGDPDHDDRTDVDRVGGEGRGRGPEARVGQSDRGNPLVSADEHRFCRTFHVRVSGAAPSPPGRHASAWPLHRVPARRNTSFQGLSGVVADMSLSTQWLRKAGVVGLNRRNADYTLRYNARSLYPLVDDKLRTKRLAQEAGIAVPELYGAIEIPYQVRHLSSLVGFREDFVVKPSGGSGGLGILVISGRTKRLYRRADGDLLTDEEVKHHVLNILSGMYSLAGQPDKALIEYRVRFDPVFEAISYLGVPDVRIIVFLGVPVMAMVRLPTRMSGGRANLHQGAIGAGIDMATGTTLTAVWRNDVVEEHPDTGNGVSDVQIPKWPELLALAARCFELTGLGYQGVDIVLDRDKGPLILELNARPGLAIQIANRSGLLPRLKAVEEHHDCLKTPEDRVGFARDRFFARGPLANW
jgi:alpha-L-glutamate ligase-like protein